MITVHITHEQQAPRSEGLIIDLDVEAVFKGLKFLVAPHVAGSKAQQSLAKHFQGEPIMCSGGAGRGLQVIWLCSVR